VGRRFDFQRVFATLFRPRQAFEMIKTEARSSWLMPMLILSLVSLLVVLVSGYLKTRAAMMGEIPLPPGWEYWMPEMQNNYMQAQQLNQGPVVMYVFPLVSAWARLWVGWVVLGGLLHLGSTLLGGRGSMQSALSITAWAFLPFALRDILRVFYMLIEKHAINSPGLSGFGTSVFMVEVLSHIDIFLIWSLVLLMVGFAVVDGLTRGKAVLGVLLVILIILSAQAGLGTIFANMGGSATQRPL
jgi:Yip1 domain.